MQARDKLTINSIKIIISQLFDATMKENNFDGVSLNYFCFPIKSNASVAFNGDVKNLKININIFNFLFKNGSTEKTIFDIYNNFFHEFEHIKVIRNATNPECSNYNYLFTILEYIEYAKSVDQSGEFTSFNILQLFTLNRLLKKNYSISSNEINSNLVGYSEAFQRLEATLEKEDIEIYRNIIDSLEFLNNNIEIKYDRNGYLVDKFSTVISSINLYLLQHKDIIQKYPILKILFKEDGSIKNIYELYQEINDRNRAMYDRLITNLFLSWNCDLSVYMKDISFKKYIENLANRYNNDCIHYFNNIEIGKVFVPNESILYENLRVKKQKILILNKQERRYDLNINSGIVLDRNFK